VEAAVVLFPERVEDAALDGLEAVVEVGDGAVEDDVAGVFEEPVAVGVGERGVVVVLGFDDGGGLGGGELFVGGGGCGAGVGGWGVGRGGGRGGLTGEGEFGLVVGGFGAFGHRRGKGGVGGGRT
jgi:hypothetical protein